MRDSAWLAAVLCSGVVVLRTSAQTPNIYEGHVPQPRPLGALIHDAESVFVLRIAKVDAAEEVITFKTVAQLKGKYPDDEVRHSLGGLDDPWVREWAVLGLLKFGPDAGAAAPALAAALRDDEAVAGDAADVPSG